MLATGPAFQAGDAALVDHVAGQRGQAHFTTGDDPALGVADRVGGEHVQASACFDQPAVADVGGAGGEVVGGTQGADVDQVAAADQVDVTALNQRAVGGDATVGVGQVQHRRQHLLAVDLDLLHPDDVVGQRGDLLGAERHAYAQRQLVLAGDGVVHQVAEQLLVGGLAGEEALAGAG